MKKLLLAILLSLGLILTLTACGGSTSTDTSSDTAEEEKEENMEPPVSDVSGGTGLQGTWKAQETDNETGELVQLALNSDDTFTLYTEAESSDNASAITSVDGKYTATDTELTLEPEETVSGQDPGVFKTGDDGKVVLKYTVNDTTLTLTNDQNETETLTRQ